MEQIKIDTEQQFKEMTEKLETLAHAEIGTKEAAEYKMYVQAIRDYIKRMQSGRPQDDVFVS